MKVKNKPQDGAYLGCLSISMPKMSHASKNHGNAMFIGSGDDLIITHRTARLDDTFNASFGGVINTVSKWEKSI